tara:strand:- start:21 stop:311 length:291 start_codon:yes stop_codon:yes gene_type:complete
MSTNKFKLLNGVEIEMTQAELDEQTLPQSQKFSQAMICLRVKRNKLLTETDYLGASDNTMSSAMTIYRQALRDLTNGLTTLDEVNAVTFPTKPEDN